MPTTPATESAPPAIGLAATGDRCANCGAPMAGDQHYCLECGERRGQARFTSTAPMGGTMTSSTTRSEPPPRGSRFSAGTTLIAGVATLLLAMGIGVLIGNESASSSSPAQTASKVQVVTVGGGSSGGAATAATNATTAPTGNGASSGAANKSHKSNKSANAATSASSSTAAQATTPTTVKKLPPATVTIGAKGSGPGYQHGKFTGNFFGP